MKLKVAAAAAVFALGACAYRAEIPPDPTDACVNALPGDQRFVSLVGKVDLGYADTPSFAVLNRHERPSLLERYAVADWVAADERCTALGAAWRATYLSSAQNNVMARAGVFFKALASRLYRAELTYSEFATLRSQGMLKLLAEFDAAAPVITGGGSWSGGSGGGCGSRGGPGWRKGNGQCASWRD